MARINGSTGKNSSHWSYYVEVTELNVNVANNTSQVKVDLYLGASSYSGATRGNISATHYINTRYNGQDIQYTFATGAYNISKNQTILLGSITSNSIPHNDDGSLTLEIEAESPDLATGSGYGPYSGFLNGNVQLTKIARKSSVLCADGNIGSSTTININRASSSFTHTLKYSFGSLIGTIATKTNNTSIGWTIPTSFYAQIPNAKSGKGTITCETYSGNTLIGSSTCNFNAIVLESTNKPSISASVEDTNTTTIALTGNKNKLVKYFSNAKVVITATAKNSATIKSQKVVCGDGKSATTATSTLNKVESGSFVVSTSDSRGYSNSATINKTLVNYIKLAITELNIARESSTSNTIKATLKGNYFNSSFGSVANTLALKWRYRIAGGSWSGYTTITATLSGNTFTYSGTLGTAFDYQKAYEFEIVAQDKLITDTKTKSVTIGIPLFDIWKDNFKVNGTNTANKFVGPLQGNADTSTKATNDSDGTKISTYYPRAGAIERFDFNATSSGLAKRSFLGTVNDTNKIWYNLINVRHRNGEGDGTSYGMQMRKLLTSPNSVLEMRSQTGTNSWNSWEQIYRRKTLYNNTSGTTGSVTLNESVANFDCIEIIYDGGYISKRVFSPNGKMITIPLHYYVNSLAQVQFAYLTISGTTITKGKSYYFSHDNQGESNDLKIYKVIGYR